MLDLNIYKQCVVFKPLWEPWAGTRIRDLYSTHSCSRQIYLLSKRTINLTLLFYYVCRTVSHPQSLLITHCSARQILAVSDRLETR